ncbi:MAG TPA: M48 family metalloprotease [Methylomirabilota bacterium]|nr:M48 family metalloprotease [Methylomirabilota bacterium]
MTSEDRARTYHRWQLVLSLAGFLLSAAYLAALLWSGVATALARAVSGVTSHWWLALALDLILLAGVYRVVTLPLSWLAGFWLPRRFGLLHQSLTAWCLDQAKTAAVAAALGLAGAEIVYGLLGATTWWWLWGALVFLAGFTVLAMVVPVWLVPLFYRLSPLDNGDLKRRLLTLAERAGVPVMGVWVADQSRKSRTANAAVTGLGHTRRILVFDTLVAEFTPDEVEAVLAHELAHHVHGDMRRALVFQGALTLAAFWIADRWLRAGAGALGLAGPADLAGVPLFGLILMALTVIALPVANSWSRRIERQADDFALGVAGNPTAFITALERLGALNLAERDPHVLKEFFLYSHPSIGRRVARARARLGLTT